MVSKVDAFKSDGGADARRMLQDIRLLRHFRHQNIVGVCDAVVPASFDDFDGQVIIVEDYMEANLSQVIQSEQPLSHDHLQFFVYQILCGLKVLHDAGVVHRNLMPGNILINRDCLIRISDIRLQQHRSEGHLDNGIKCRWYEAPEV